MYESTIQGKIIKVLEINRWYVIKLIQTNKNGIPDLLALKNNRCVFIEVKRPGGIISDLQKYRHKELNRAGVPVIIAYSEKDILNIIDAS